MKILMIGGSGNISWHCTNKLLENGHDVYVLNRKCTILTRRELNPNAKRIVADINDLQSVKQLLGNTKFDIVADFICYKMEDAQRDIELFGHNTKHFIFISSAGNYKREGYCLPITEERELTSINWEYSKNKIQCEQIFMKAYREQNFPVTIIRPGHTYDTLIPEAVGNGDWTIAKRIIEKKPIIVHGDGTVWWTLTNSYDFAAAFAGVAEDTETIGEAYHIVGDEVLTWNEITHTVAHALGNPMPDIVYIPAKTIELEEPVWGAGITEHKMWCDVYDNSKIKQVVPTWKTQVSLRNGIEHTVNWLNEKECRKRVNLGLDHLIDKLCTKYR
jgi:Nucleoside-diphosphate-sugar epimerases